jgi:hypothetical protein
MNLRRFAAAMGVNVVAIAILLWLLGNLSALATAESTMNQVERPVPLFFSDATSLHYVPITGAKTLTASGTGSTTGMPQSLNSGQHFLPSYGNDRDRFGFLVVDDTLTSYDVAQLHAGWYCDREATVDPSHPDSLVYAQLVSFTAGPDEHDPSQVTVNPSRDVIAQIAAAHPGSLWMMGDTSDSFNLASPLFPEVYAHVYHEYYHYIKGLDPTALIANGGIIQPTPCRLEYLDIVWDTYYRVYSRVMKTGSRCPYNWFHFCSVSRFSAYHI